MTKLVFATGNAHKVREVNQVLDGQFEVVSLRDIGCLEDIPETRPTIEGNALQKARYVFEKYGYNCFSEDTGLEVRALNGEPGVHTARYAGDDRDNEANMQLVLTKLANQPDRAARFKTVIALILDGKEYTFTGVANGQIRTEKSGTGGFGYDPIFQPDGYDMTFAEMPMAEKNAISHRGKAVQKLVAFLHKI